MSSISLCLKNRKIDLKFTRYYRSMNCNIIFENGIYKINIGNFLLCFNAQHLHTVVTTNWIVNDTGIYKEGVPILMVLFPNTEKYDVFFKDGNSFNFDQQNMEFVMKSKMKTSVDQPDFEFEKKIPGVFKTLGKSAYHEKNNAYLLHNGDIKLHVGDNIYTTIDAESLEMIRKFEGQQMCWYRLANGYVGSHYTSQNDKDSIIYLHQLLTNFYCMKGNKDTYSVDHIDRNKLNNKKSNLRIITQSEQNQNCDKRNRKYNAQELPEEIQESLPKFVTYNREVMNKETGQFRDFFRIEKHPKLQDKIWSSSKSMKLSILEKLQETKDELYRLEHDIPKEVPEIVFPTGIRIQEKDEKFMLILDRKLEDKRYNMKMVMDKTKSPHENLDGFIKKIKSKYPELEF
jgi:hypothetical protein